MKIPSRNSWLSLTGATLLMAALSACSPTVPKIDTLKIGKDKEVTKEATTYAPKDTVYGFAKISAPGKVTIKWQVVVVKAEGVAENFHVPNADANVELPGSGTSTYNFPPGDGFPAGKYRLEVRMVDETGAEKDSKTIEYTVAGS